MQTSKPSAESSKTRAVPSHVHGKWNGYATYKCRCAECAEAGREYGIARRAGKATPPELLTPKKEASHGTAARYRAGCDCEPCIQAGAKRRVPLGVPSTLRRYRYRLEPSLSVASGLNRLFGAARWARNEYIARARAAYAAGEGHISGYSSQKLVITDGRANPDTAWLLEYPSSVLRASVQRGQCLPVILRVDQWSPQRSTHRTPALQEEVGPGECGVSPCCVLNPRRVGEHPRSPRRTAEAVEDWPRHGQLASPAAFRPVDGHDHP